MTWGNVLVSFVIIAILSLVTVVIVREKKNGAKCTTCVGCPYNNGCSKSHD